MPLTATGPTEIDRKLHRIVLDASSGQFPNMISLSRSIGQSKPTEFSYRRLGRTEYSGAQAIAFYVAFAREIGLLDENLIPTRSKADVGTLKHFQPWLNDKVAEYLNGRGSSPDQLGDVVSRLLHHTPSKLPSQQNIRPMLENPPPSRFFQMSLRITALLRPRTLSVVTRRIVLVPGVLEP
ncbi:MAG TPA: hypothetical protein VFA45_15145 [Actinomycetes bacterium]|jgi:hypothetical protein|nr:hypothetical protein [Actinomycetes bacterium]